jgi:hypothetical protein
MTTMRHKAYASPGINLARCPQMQRSRLAWTSASSCNKADAGVWREIFDIWLPIRPSRRIGQGGAGRPFTSSANHRFCRALMVLPAGKSVACDAAKSGEPQMTPTPVQRRKSLWPDDDPVESLRTRGAAVVSESKDGAGASLRGANGRPEAAERVGAFQLIGMAGETLHGGAEIHAGHGGGEDAAVTVLDDVDRCPARVKARSDEWLICSDIWRKVKSISMLMKISVAICCKLLRGKPHYQVNSKPIVSKT